MHKGDKFLVLEDEYLKSFDDIVIIGDIHGCFDEFKELLDKVHTETPSKNPDRCLKILVGDLVNKGPKSKEVIDVCMDIYPKSIIAVRGNHDEIVIQRYKEYKSGATLEPKNEWIRRLSVKHITYLERLPYTITIPSLNCIIVHAGLNPLLEDPAKTTPLNIMTTMRNITVEKGPKKDEIHYNCTKSDKVGAPWATFWPGPQHIYFGHDAKRRLQSEHEFATGLDTGCVYGDRLSYVYIKGSRKGEILSIKAKKVYEEPKG